MGTHRRDLEQQLRQLQYDAQLLSSERGGGAAARPKLLGSLAGQRERLQELERQMRARPGPPVVVPPRHRRAFEQASEALEGLPRAPPHAVPDALRAAEGAPRCAAPSGAICAGTAEEEEEDDDEEEEMWDGQLDIDAALAQRHARMRADWLEHACNATIARTQERLHAQDRADHLATAARLRETRAVRRALLHNGRSVRLRPGKLTPELSYTPGAIEGGGGSVTAADCRMSCFAEAVDFLPLVGRPNPTQVAKCLLRMRAACSGPPGRSESAQQCAEAFIDAAGAVLCAAAEQPPPPERTGEDISAAQLQWQREAALATGAASRVELEQDFRQRTLQAWRALQEPQDAGAQGRWGLPPPPLAADEDLSTQQLVEAYIGTAINWDHSLNDPATARWAAAFFALRSGDTAELRRALCDIRADCIMQQEWDAVMSQHPRFERQVRALRAAGAAPALSEEGWEARDPGLLPVVLDHLDFFEYGDAIQEVRSGGVPREAFAALDADPPSWPPVVGAGGALPPECAALRTAARSVPNNKAQTAYQCATLLVLSRSATNREQDELRTQLTSFGGAALHFTQDHMWLHLALAGTAPPLEEEADQPDRPYSIAAVQRGCLRLRMHEEPAFRNDADPLFKARWLIWAQCAPRALWSVLPPAVSAETADFTMESLHVALLFNSLGLLPDTAAQQEPGRRGAPAPHGNAALCTRDLHLLLSEYIELLVPSHPEAALLYMQHLPLAVREFTVATVGADRVQSLRLLGSVGDRPGPLIDSAAEKIFDVAEPGEATRERALLTAAAARGAARQGQVLTATELWLVTAHLVQDDRDFAAEAAGFVRELADMLLPELTRAVEKCAVGQVAGDLATAADRCAAHHETLLRAGGQGNTERVQAMVQLRCALQLCIHAKAGHMQETWDLWQHSGLLPTHPDQLQATAERANRGPEVSSALREVLRCVNAAVLEFVISFWRGAAAGGAGSAASAGHFREMAHLLICFDGMLTSYASPTTQATLQQCKAEAQRWGAC
eukprot:TRINITY_DN1340_c1_g1_i1.p1 TRINITY_DN1340_c1_g1~~TRINITY_DN1340_c1_g1_i1.p1  ORF type:complete len:1056 (+),score=397.45 TRINITY_DN1340_c1_g1_i1:122-3169(+)